MWHAMLRSSAIPKTSPFRASSNSSCRGGTELAARLHVARTVARRAERNASALPDLAPVILKYLNRLGDLLFAWAWAEAEHGGTDIDSTGL